MRVNYSPAQVRDAGLSRLEFDGQQMGLHTFSAGVADSNYGASVDELADVLLKRADDCALQAKRAGRNRVIQHQTGETAASP